MDDLRVKARRVARPARLALLVVLTVLGLWIIPHSAWELVLMGWVVLVLAALGLVRFLLHALFPPDLILSSEGFRVAGLGKDRFVRWAEVERFWEVRLPSGSFILYGGSGQKRTSFGLWVFRGLPSEADGFIPGGLSRTNDEVLQLLNEWKARFGQR